MACDNCSKDGTDRGGQVSMSIVLPAHNEADNITPMYDSLVSVLSPLGLREFEILFIDDGSTDRTSQRVADLAATDSRVKLIELLRPFGHQAALTAGLMHARGDVVITMDADLQHPAEMIPLMLERFRAGSDVVYARRKGQQRGLCKNLLSAAFYACFKRTTRVAVFDGVSDFRLMSSRIVHILNTMEERDRFLRGMVPWIGGRSDVVEYSLQPRIHGAPSYTLSQSLRLGLAGLMSFSTAPLTAIFVVGLAVSLLSFGYGLYLVGHKIVVGTAVPGYTDIIAGVLFLGGLNLTAIGIVGRFLAIVLDEVRARPNYIIRRTVGIACNPAGDSTVSRHDVAYHNQC